MIDGADTGDSVPSFEMAPRVPGKRADAVTEFDAILFQALGHAERTTPNIRIVRAMHRPFDGARDDLAPAVLDRRMVDDPVQEQRPILHQTPHLHSSSCLWAGSLPRRRPRGSPSKAPRGQS